MSEVKQVDIKSLSIQQLYEIQQQLQQEIDHLSDSFSKLRQALTKFQDCSDTVKLVSNPANEENEILVPLTSSLYIPGKMQDVDKFMVDVGTGYYVEKNSEDSIEFFHRKVKTLTKNLNDLETVVNNKYANLRAVSDALNKKVVEQQQEKK
ncbi:prefoldin subunit 5 [Trichomonascus vanleenenianus]|uniref:Gim5p n=1 Tax=Trichomonascus vanleenenianus TaxID=2268995 RepID=UPI003EC9C3CC